MRAERSKDSHSRPGLFGLALAIAWTLATAGSLAWNWDHLEDSVRGLALVSAQLSFDKDAVYRRWATDAGGVYAFVTDESPPNPHLKHVRERDITTPSGRTLTLINPEYMTRQVHALEGEHGAKGHITSLRPLRPENRPDAWEEKALKAFEAGASERVEEQTIDGQLHLRLMRPLKAEKACVKCHSAQGYKVGEVRGGVSVSVPMAPYLLNMEVQQLSMVGGHGLVWLAGLLGLALATSRLVSARRREETAQTQAVADKLRLLSAARQQQQMKSVGTLASGVAHEINNPLNVIMNFGQLILDEEDCPPAVQDYAKYIGAESQRIALIVDALIDFARPDQQATETTNIDHLAQDVCLLMHGVFRTDNISLKESYANNLPAVNCRGQQVKRVLLSLMNNARYAVNQRYPEPSDDKNVTVEMTSLEEGGQTWVRCTVGDTGNGIPTDIADRIFEPFFSSKPRHVGTGLGLSISYGIVEDHGGRLWFESEPGVGTRFHMDLKADTD